MKNYLKTMPLFFAFALLLCFIPSLKGKAQTSNGICKSSSTCDMHDKKETLVVIWSSDDPMVAKRVALMYPHAAKRNQWFDEVILVIWGPSAKLISEDVELQQKLAQMKKDGVNIQACIACANEYGVTDKLKELSYDIIPMGVPLTNYLKKGHRVLTF